MKFAYDLYTLFLFMTLCALLAAVIKIGGGKAVGGQLLLILVVVGANFVAFRWALRVGVANSTERP